MIKRLLYIFIPVLAVFLMSHNVFATTLNLVPSSARVFYSVPGENSISYIDLTNLYTVSNLQDIKGWKLSSGLNINQVCYVFNRVIEKNSLFSFSFSAMNVGVGTISGGTVAKIDSVSPIYTSNVDTNSFRPISYFITGHLVENAASVCIGDNYNVNNVLLFDDSYSVTDNIYLLQPKINFYDISDPSNETLNETKQETQDAADNSATAGDSSTSDSESATSSLLSVIGSGIGAITSATPSNCKINGNMGNLDMGQIDLCANPVPTFVAVIGSFIAVALVLPLVIILFNRFISIIRSFQS